MKIKLANILFKARASDLDQTPQETIIDIIGQNYFLKRLTLALSLSLCALSATLLWQAFKLDRVVYILQPENTKYAEDLPAQTPAEAIPSPISPNADIGAKPIAPIIIPVPSELPDTPNRPKPEIPAAKPALPQLEKRMGLWDLMEQLRSDPMRESLEKTFNVNGIQIVFKEASPKGLISFELINESKGPLYLPGIQISGKPHKVYLERRVLEINTNCAGIIQMESLEETRILQLKFTAANAKPENLTLEIPRW